MVTKSIDGSQRADNIPEWMERPLANGCSPRTNAIVERMHCTKSSKEPTSLRQSSIGTYVRVAGKALATIPVAASGAVEGACRGAATGFMTGGLSHVTRRKEEFASRFDSKAGKLAAKGSGIFVGTAQGMVGAPLGVVINSCVIAVGGGTEASQTLWQTKNESGETRQSVRDGKRPMPPS